MSSAALRRSCRRDPLLPRDHGSPGAGEGYELDAIASAVVGGTSLAGGTGSIPGTVIGALIIAVIGNGLDLLGVSSYWQDIVKGAIIVVAVLLDRNKKRQ